MKKDSSIHFEMHHAVLFYGDRLASESKIKEALGLSKSWSSDNDIVYSEFEDMGVSDARQFQSRAVQLPYMRARVTFVIVAQSITREAQNSLLKLFEDTPKTCQFFVIVPSKNLIIPTLLSRFFTMDMQTDSGDIKGQVPMLSEATGLLAKIKDDDSYRETLRRVLASNRTNAPAFSKSLLLLESFTDSKGASQKMLFENAMLAYYEARIQG